MKNLTLRVDEGALEAARRVAAEQATSVNAMVRDFLAEIAKTGDRRVQVRQELVKLSRESDARIGKRSWRREDLHDR